MRSHQHIGKLGALVPHEIHRLTVPGVNHWTAQEGSGCVRDPDNFHFVVVHLQLAVKFEGFVRKKQDVPGVIGGTARKRLFWVPTSRGRWRIDWPRTNRG